jgi:hypothetical protein
MTSAQASAAPFLFELSGGKTASFAIDTDSTPMFLNSSFIGDQVSYSNVAGTFGGAAGTATIGFGTFLVAQLNILGTPLGFTQYGGPDFFSIVGNKPIFNTGSYALNSITSGAATLTISALPAVPEPASWALMIAGFALVGSSMRRRSMTLSFAK